MLRGDQSVQMFGIRKQGKSSPTTGLAESASSAVLMRFKFTCSAFARDTKAGVGANRRTRLSSRAKTCAASIQTNYKRYMSAVGDIHYDK